MHYFVYKILSIILQSFFNIFYCPGILKEFHSFIVCKHFVSLWHFLRNFTVEECYLFIEKQWPDGYYRWMICLEQHGQRKDILISQNSLSHTRYAILGGYYMPFPSLKVHAQRIRYFAINAIIARVFKSLPLQYNFTIQFYLNTVKNLQFTNGKYSYDK